MEWVWGIKSGSDEEKIDVVIFKICEFFESLGVGIRFSDYGFGEEVVDLFVD